MEYKPKMRIVYLYTVAKKELKELLTFTHRDQIISHMKLARNPKGDLMVVYVQRSKTIIAYDTSS